MGSEKVCELGLKLGTPEAQQCYMSARCSQGFNILRLTTLFCVIVFNLIHSLGGNSKSKALLTPHYAELSLSPDWPARTDR